MPITVAIVDDDTKFLETAQEVLGRDEQFRCVAVCRSAESALATLPALRPNVVLMDINLPAISGIECVSQLRPVLPETQFLMLTVLDEPERVFESLSCGATGYLLKGVSPEQLLADIEDLHSGGSPMSASIARKVVLSFRRSPPPPGSEQALSGRESEVLGALARGARYKEIADQFGVSYHTVRTHLNRIYRKLQVHSRAEAIRKRYPSA